MYDYESEYNRRFNGVTKVINNNIYLLSNLKMMLKDEMERNHPQKEMKLKVLNNRIKKAELTLSKYQNVKKFLRKGNKYDMDKRIEYMHFFPSKLREVMPNSNLCFHGTTIYGAEGIINSGEISSSVDRNGVASSYDTDNQVSVTVLKTLETTIGGYAGLEDAELPAGCVFVVTPKDEEDIKSAKNSMMIKNVNFKEDPSRLVAILTTEESAFLVRSWCRNNGIDEKVVLTYEQFLDKQKKLNEMKDRG